MGELTFFNHSFKLFFEFIEHWKKLIKQKIKISEINDVFIMLALYKQCQVQTHDWTKTRGPQAKFLAGLWPDPSQM